MATNTTVLKKKKKKKWSVGDKIALGGAFIALLALFATLAPEDGFRDSLCRNEAGEWPGVSSFCGEEYIRINQEGAEAFLMHFYNQAGSGDAETAYTLTTEAYRATISPEDFQKLWENHAWADGRLNTYEIVIRHYKGEDVSSGAAQFKSGDIIHRKSKVTLQKVDGLIQFHRASDAQRTKGGHEKIEEYPRWKLNQAHSTYESPILDEQSTERRSATGFKAGGGLNVLCLLSPAASADSHITEDWARTPQGWIPTAVLTNPSEDGDDAQIAPCHARYGEQLPLWQ